MTAIALPLPSYVEMPVRVRQGRAHPYPADELRAGARIGSQLQATETAVVISCPATGVRAVTDYVASFHEPHGIRAFAVYRWLERDFSTDREIVGVTVYCPDHAHAVAVRLRFSEDHQRQGDSWAA